MEFNSWGKKPVESEKKNRCEIVIEKTARGVRKKIIGNCSRDQLRALSESGDNPSTND